MLYVNTLDDEIVLDGNRSFAGGQYSFPKPTVIPLNAATELKNMDVSQTKSVNTRRGHETLGQPSAGGSTTAKLQGLFFFQFGSTEYLVGVKNNLIIRYDDTSWTVHGSGDYQPAAGNDVDMAQVAGKMVFTDGSVNMKSWDGTTFTDLGNGDFTTNTTKAPRAKYVIEQRHRLIAAGHDTHKNSVWGSDVIDVDVWDWNKNEVKVAGGEQDPITGIYDWINNFVFVGCENSSHIILANPNDEDATTGWAALTIKMINKIIGLRSHRSLAQVGHKLFGLFNDGIRDVARIMQGAQEEVGEPISAPIQDIIDRINWAAADKSCGIPYRHYYILGVPLDGATENNAIIVFNDLKNLDRAFTYWTGLDPAVYAVSLFGGIPRLNMGKFDGKIYRWRDYVIPTDEIDSDYQDEGTDYESKIVGRGMDFRAEVSLKTGDFVDVEFFRSGGSVAVGVIKDDTGHEKTLDASPITTNTNLSLPFDLPFELPFINSSYYWHGDLLAQEEFRDLQIVLTASSGKMSVRGIRAGAFIGGIETEI